MNILNKWYFWAAAIVALYLFKNNSAGSAAAAPAADIYGAAGNARNTLTSFFSPAVASVNTGADIAATLKTALAPYNTALEPILKNTSNVSAQRTQEINDYTAQMVAVTNAIKAGNPTI